MLIYPDLSQLEYRLIAHGTGDAKLITAFRNGEDIHTGLYVEIFGKRPKDTKDRKIAKTARYAEVYGTGFAKFLYLLRLSGVKISVVEGRRIFDMMKGKFEAIDEYKNELKHELRGGGWLRNLFGRERYFDPKYFRGQWDKSGVKNMLREAFNWVFQSSGHDITELWTMECVDLIDNKKVLLVNEVHDEFVLDVPLVSVKNAISAIKFVSSNLNTLIEETFSVRLQVPITVEIDKGKYWR